MLNSYHVEPFIQRPGELEICYSVFFVLILLFFLFIFRLSLSISEKRNLFVNHVTWCSSPQESLLYRKANAEIVYVLEVFCLLY